MVIGVFFKTTASCKKNLALIFSSLLICCALSNCATKGGWGYSLSGDKTTIEELSSKGVSVMRLGDDMRIIIPSQTIFVDYSVKISPSGQETLNQVAEILAPMNKVKITIAAYTAAPDQSDKDLFLTDKQAQAVSNYLWGHHVDVRMIYAVGYGGGHPAQYNPNVPLNNIIGDRANYRLEITLKDYP